MTNEIKYIWEQNNWPDFYFDREKLIDLLLEISKYQGKFNGIFSLMRKSSLIDTKSEIMLDEAINTSAIEGEILHRDSVRSSIHKKLGVDRLITGKATPQTDGLVNILDDLSKNNNLPLNKKRLLGWHAALFPTGYSGLQKIKTGSYRGNTPMRVVSGPFGKEKVHYLAPPGIIVNQEMTCFLKWLNSDQETNGVIKSAIAHLWFVAIHPFEDGNGRLTRAIGDYVLSKYEKMPFRFYSLSTFIYQNIKEYYQILEETTKSGMDITKWIIWYLKIVLYAMQNAEIVFKKIIFKTKFWIYFSNVNLNERQKKAINKMLDIGKDKFEGGINTRKYASMNKISKPTASRELKYMVEAKLLIQITGTSGRNVSYQLFDNFDL